jgi:hypothetical protein
LQSPIAPPASACRKSRTVSRISISCPLLHFAKGRRL